MVRLSGLADGLHEFDFDLDQRFFEQFEQSEITQGRVKVHVELEKKAGTMTLRFALSGDVDVVCDRCLTPFRAPFETSQRMFLKPGDEPGEVNDEVVVIARDAHEVDVAQWLYEFIVLALPVQRIHPDGADGQEGCDPVMLQHLRAHQAGSAQEEKTSDPRWDALKDIKGKSK